MIGERKRFAEIDALKGIAIFLVVLGHSIIVYPINLHEDPVCATLLRWITSVHMPLFFTISGFCYSYHGRYWDFMKKKIQRLIIPYVVFGLIDLVPRMMLPSLVRRSQGVKESLKDMLLYGGEYWFLYTLFIIFMIYPLIDKILRDNIKANLLLLLVMIVICALMPKVELFKLWYDIYYLIFFVTGFLVRKIMGTKIFDAKFKAFRFYWATFVAAWGLWIALVLFYKDWMRMPIAFIGIISIYLCVRYDIVIKLFARFGEYTLQLYLLNGFLVVISRTIIVSVLGVTNPAIIILFNMFIDFGLSYLFIKYVCTKIKPVRFIMGM